AVEESGEELLETERAPHAEEEAQGARLGDGDERAVLHTGERQVLDELRVELALVAGRAPGAARRLDACPRRTVEEDEAREEEEGRGEERREDEETRAGRRAREEPADGRKGRDHREGRVGERRNRPEKGPPDEGEAEYGRGGREPGVRATLGLAAQRAERGGGERRHEDERQPARQGREER